MKADLHVHSYHSGYAGHFRLMRVRDCYSSPEAVYATAKRRGMDLVCLTDHNSIDGCLEFLDAHPDAPDFLVGEEIECVFPDVPDLRIHLGAIGMTERRHREIQPLRGNAFELAAYLREERVFFAVNHLFFFFRADQISLQTYVERMLTLAPAIEIHNGAMRAEHNRLVSALRDAAVARGATLALSGGSDAHTLASVGTAYTETDGSTRDEFLAHLAAGRARTGGRHGTVGRMSTEIYGVILKHWRSLVGLDRSELQMRERIVSAACAVALAAPTLVVPALVALGQKIDEGRRIRQCALECDGEAVGVPPAIARTSAS